jgi:hypothetical protein
MQVDYYIPMHNGEVSQINGWTPEQVRKDWFENYPINQFHASRDSHALMGSKKILDTKVVDPDPNEVIISI